MIKNFEYVYFDGSLCSFSTLYWTKDQFRRIWVIMPVNVDDSLKRFVHSFCDCMGTLNHMENGKIVWHISYGYPDQCIHRFDQEYYFNKIANLSQERQDEITSITRVCFRKVDTPCLKCDDCVNATRIAEMYGLYDFVENTRVVNGCIM